MAKTVKKTGKIAEAEIIEPIVEKPETKTRNEIVEPTPKLSFGNTLGDILRSARESQKLTLQDVATSLRLSIKQIEALENNRFTELPGEVATRGFIRNYARLLKLAADPLLEHYRVAVPAKTLPNIAVTTSIESRSVYQKKSPLNLMLLGSAALIAVVFVFSMIKSLKPSPQAVESQSTEAATTTKTEPLPEIALPAAERVEPVALQAEGTPVQVVVPIDSANNAEVTTGEPASQAGGVPNAEKVVPNVGGATGAQLPPTPTVEVQQQVPVTAAMPTMSFAASQDTWVQVLDAEGKQVLSELITAGSEKQLTAAPPLKVVVGNKNGGVLKFNGAVIDMAPYGGKDVARLTLR